MSTTKRKLKMSREIKFRAWVFNGSFFSKDHMINNWANTYCAGEIGFQLDESIAVLMQYTGLKDKNGKEIYEGDLLNIFFTSSEGEHIHDCIYEARISSLWGVEFNFIKLLWESHGYNQYTLSTLLTSKYGSLDTDFRNQNYDKLSITNKWEENHLQRNRWKGNDYSNYFEVIGNTYENPELLKGN